DRRRFPHRPGRSRASAAVRDQTCCMSLILIDRSVPRGVADALKYVRDDVRWLDDEFPHGTPDHVWLARAGATRWLVIMRDKKVRSRPAERRAILENNVGCFCLIQKHDPTRWGYLK